VGDICLAVTERYAQFVAYVSSRERDSAAEALRGHFVSGRLTLDEFTDRVRLALVARHTRDLRRALRGLPPAWRDGDEVRRVARAAKRGAVVAIVTALWLAVSLVLLIAFAATAITSTVTTSDAVGYPVAWLIVSALAWRAARRA
jgi:uncharacterized protein DUF1707